MPRLRAILFFAFLQATGTGLLAQALPQRLRDTLATDLKASRQQLRTLEDGGIVSYSVETGAKDEIMLVGMARIWATPDAFVRCYRDISAFESSPGVTAGSKFSIPPTESDFNGLTLTKAEVDDIKECKPGECAFKIDDMGLQFLRSAVRWDSPGYFGQSNKALRALWLRYLVRYQSTGNAGLPIYHDKPTYFSVEKGVSELLAKASALHEYGPQLEEYLRDYPRSKNESAEEFFYWQVGEFGLKPVHRVTHVVIQRTPASFGDAFVIASKMLFASHYFRSALEFRFLIPGQDQRIGGMHYLINVQRSYVDGMTGFRGRFLHSIVVRKSRQAMKRHIASVKDKVEREFNQK